MSVAQSGMPAVFHVRKSGSKGKRRTGIRAKEPMEACTTFGWKASAESSESQTPAAPNQSANRTMVPKLPGSRTPSSTR